MYLIYKKHVSYNIQCVIGCFYLMLMTIQTVKEAQERRKYNVKLSKKDSSKDHQSKVCLVLVSSAKYVIRKVIIIMIILISDNDNSRGTKKVK